MGGGLKSRLDAYGVGVRAGAITPQPEDEGALRTEMGLPPMSEAAQEAWEEDHGVRRPITLREADGSAPASPSLAAEPDPE